MSNGAESLESAAIRAVNIGAWQWEIDADRITWSDNVNEIFGLKGLERACRSSDVDEFVHPEDRARFRADLERVRNNSAPWEITHRLSLPGHERWVHARGSLVCDAGGPRRVIGVVEDVTVGRSLASDLADRSALMQAALDASVFAVVVLDSSGNIIYSNQLAADLLGLTCSAARERAYDAPQFKHTDVDGGPWPDENQPFVRVMKTGKEVRGIEHRIERPDGRVITLRINGAPIKDDRGAIQLVVCSFEDITERRAIELAFRQSQKMEAVGRLAGGVAHDFNNLLTAILSYAALARGELTNPASLLDCLDGITEAGERAAQLTRQLLTFARREVSHPISFDACAEARTTARLITRVVGAHVTLELDLAEKPCWIRMDPNHLQQVLLNLAINARDAMPDGGKITLSVQRTDHGSALIALTDTGHGMDEKTMHNAFEPFFTTKEAHEGTGLGLSTCHGIVVQAGGRIAISSEPGHGTRVEVELPLAAAPETGLTTPEAASLQGRPGARILVVEDDPSVRRIAVHALERAGYRVHAAAHATQAFNVLEVEPIDLIVCDLVLPGMSGPDLIQRVRLTQPRMPVLFVSGYSNELARTGIDPFLSKPYSPGTLRERVAAVLNT